MAVDKNKRIKRRVRNAYIVSTVSIALVLFLLGAVGYLIMGALNATERLKENVTVYVMLRDDITAEQSAALKPSDARVAGLYEQSCKSCHTVADTGGCFVFGFSRTRLLEVG